VRVLRFSKMSKTVRMRRTREGSSIFQDVEDREDEKNP